MPIVYYTDYYQHVKRNDDNNLNFGGEGYMDLLERIKELASKQGLSMRQIEINCGFSNGSLTKWSTQSPAIDKVIKVADYLHSSLRYLATGEDEKTSQPTLTCGEQAILDQVQHLTENQKLQLSGAISMLVAMQSNPFSQAQNINDFAAVGLFTDSSSRE